MSLRRLLRRAGAAPSHSNYRIRLTPKWQAALSSSAAVIQTQPALRQPWSAMFLFRSKDTRAMSPPRSRDKDAPVLHDYIQEGTPLSSH